MTLRPEPYEEIADDRTFDGLEALEAAARERGTDSATFALAWVLENPLVTAVIVGPRRPEHLEPVRAALELRLSEAERDELGGLFA
jgi:aryl-alcohol dehydrogenase-like predicted oxidoreductase